MKNWLLRIAFGVFILISSVALLSVLSLGKLDMNYRKSRAALHEHLKKTETYGLTPPTRVLVERLRLSTDLFESSTNVGSIEGKAEALKQLRQTALLLEYNERSEARK
jgi:hypothetical protein